MIPKGFHRPRKGETCFACGKADWCLISDTGTQCLCKRIESPMRWKDAGFLHAQDGASGAAVDLKGYAKNEPKPRFIDCDAVLQRYLQDTTRERVARFADLIGVSSESLRALGARWSVRHEAWAFPLSNHERKVVGIRYRTESGEKFSMKGGSEGVFLPTSEPARTIYMPEGPTDTAALLSIGLYAIGRPNNSNGATLVRRLLGLLKPAELIVIADRDAAGRDGAARFVADMAWTCRVVSPPRHKDVRQWVNAGATAAAIECVARSARYTHFARAG